MKDFNASIEYIQNHIDKVKDIDRQGLIRKIYTNINTLLTYYECAIDEVVTKLNILNKEYSINSEQNPIDSIKSRVKDLESIAQKAEKKNIPLTEEAIIENIRDIAGVRVICNFPEDVYKIKEGLLQQDDIILIQEKDYIRKPKENGYRSLHLIIQTPIFLSSGKKMMYVEVQIRTIAQNFWASLEHQLKYKKDLSDDENLKQALKEVAEESTALDRKMEKIKHLIYKNKIDEIE